MDRNTVTGLILIGVILTGFALFNQPTEEQRKALAAKEREKEAAKKKKKAAATATKVDTTFEGNWEPKLDSLGNPAPADSGMVTYYNPKTKQDTMIPAVVAQPEPVNKTSVASVPDSLIELESDKLIIAFNAKGGSVASVKLKGFESYDNFAKKDGEITPLELFRNGDAVNELILPKSNRRIQTSKLLFAVAEHDDEHIVFEHRGEGQELIRFTYRLKKGAYDIDYDINIKGYGGKVSPREVQFKWETAYRRTERLFSEQRRVSTVCFDYKNEGFSYLSEMGDGYQEAEDDIRWVSFKQSYFSSFIQPDKPFAKEGSKFSVKTYDEGSKKATTNLKDFNARVNLNLSNVNDVSVHMNWYFGPNDYGVLKSYKSGYDNVLNYGWGIFRWINLYAVQPLFNLLQSMGLAIGIAILLLTVILKLVLMPIQWKMYTSSAKMRILKPEIDELNAKYPNKEDGLKKQTEMMTLYRESGASPLAGCVPMLIQMPILLAVFRFFPSTFDLRQKSFLWAEDLSSYDSIYDLSFHIPFYGDHISLFTLLMAGTTLIYTFINSGNMATPQQPGMPNMKVIMYFFPIMMIFFFNNYSSGLSYYYFISTLASILIMISIKRFFVDEEKLKAKMAARKAAAAGNGKGGKKTKSKFQERLEQMQKAQMEQRKNKGKK